MFPLSSSTQTCAPATATLVLKISPPHATDDDSPQPHVPSSSGSTSLQIVPQPKNWILCDMLWMFHLQYSWIPRPM